MKIRILLVLLLANILAQSMAQEINIKNTPVKWLPLYSFINKYSKAFIDEGSIRIIIDGKNKFVSQSILISTNDPVNIEVEGKIIEVNSLVKHMVVECNSMVLIPLADYYFTVAMPTREDKPVANVTYPSTPDIAKQLTKDLFIYKAFCPEYI